MTGTSAHVDRCAITDVLLQQASTVAGHPVVEEDIISAEVMHTWEQMFPNTSGPFSRPGFVAGQAFTNYVMHARFIDGVMILWARTANQDEARYVGCANVRPGAETPTVDDLTFRAWDAVTA